MIQLDLQSRVPIYEQLVKNIIRLKSLGVLKPESQLPSVRSLATELGVNPNTVQKAYQTLEARGIIFSVSGRGSFISSSESVDNELRLAAEKSLKSAVSEAYSLGISKSRAIEICEAVYSERGANL